nr:PREDICTED: anoctamin-10 isoform X1 [Bemisia tabaci]XP_018904652.1 PREDICTED: anoctamin-10 isoform X1 [Bemisia tabaci]
MAYVRPSHAKNHDTSSSKQSTLPEHNRSTGFPPTQIVIQFAADIKTLTIKWVLQKIRGLRREGGAECLVRRHPFSENEAELFVHVAATCNLLLEVAEELEIRKRDKRGILRHFVVKELEEFLLYDGPVEDIFTSAEKQSIVRYELENIRALAEESYLPGYPHLKFYEGQSIISALLHWGLIIQVFPLHDEENVRKLGTQWYLAPFGHQPFNEIKLYFGESVALYFHFLGFYTTALVLPMVFGFYQLLLSPEMLAFFCVFNVLWATGFLEMWRRKCSELAYQWGTISLTSLDDEPRPNFQGQMAIDHITGRFQPQYPRWKTNAKGVEYPDSSLSRSEVSWQMYCVSFPLVILCMCGAFIVMLVSFWCEESVRYMNHSHPLAIYVPSTIYAALVYIMNKYYRTLANFLTEWENHRTQAQFDRHRVTKLVLFEFVNNFMSLFYVAFYMKDLELLRTQLATMLIIFQAINNVQESILPFAFRCYWLKFGNLVKFKRKQKLKRSVHEDHVNLLNPKGGDEGNEDLDIHINLDIPELEPEDSRIDQARRESSMDPYEGTYDDYLELFIQFGYVTLFAAVYPMAAFWAVVNNLFEIRSDAFKLCRIYQRPLSRRVKDIGAWQRAFEVLCTISVMTNCALLYISPSMSNWRSSLSSFEWCLVCIGLEHLLFAIRQVMSLVIPDKPQWVREALAKFNFQSRQALKNQRRSTSIKEQ